MSRDLNSYESLQHPGHGETVNRSLTRELLAAKHEVRFEAAYYVNRRRGIEVGRRMVDHGVKIRVLTNSLATNDVGAAQAGYARTRPTLLRGGVELYELRPDAAAVRAQVAPHAKQARTAIHTKALVINGRTRTWSHDPETTTFQRLTNRLMGCLPIASQL
ncbi:MAG: phospholipase D-like domain-containing protein [Verrucomicrobia bacterium]|nr:phospholipase D-like domain-containing protein [Verrucomicrobiota bacterium]